MHRNIKLGKYKLKNTNRAKPVRGNTKCKIKFVKYKSGNTTRGIPIGKCYSGNSNRENIDRKIPIGNRQRTATTQKRQLGVCKIKIGTCKSENTSREKYISEKSSRKNTNREIQIGVYLSKNINRTIDIGKYKSENTSRLCKSENTIRKIHVGKYKSENTNRKIESENTSRTNTIRKT